MTDIGYLQIRGVEKTYTQKSNDLLVLQDLNININPGEFVSIVGGSGSGKSTLLRLIVGLEQASKGQILLDGKKVQGTGNDRGIVFQDSRLLPWLNVEQNVALALSNTNLSKTDKGDTIHQHLKLVGLDKFARYFPHQLSGGMAQRVSIARGLVNRPEILLLDEPFGALDAFTRKSLQDELVQIWQEEDITMILVTHDVEEAVYLSDRVLVFEPRPGRVRREVKVDLARPRSRSDAKFINIKEDILHDFFGNEHTHQVPTEDLTESIPELAFAAG